MGARHVGALPALHLASCSSRQFRPAWRQKNRRSSRKPAASDARALDLCAARRPLILRSSRIRIRVMGSDFCLHADRKRREKIPARWSSPLSKPMRSSCPPDARDLVTVALGFRNLATIRPTAEITAFLNPSVAAILEFSQPGGAVLELYDFIRAKVLPLIGGALSFARRLQLLPASIEKFPSAENLAFACAPADLAAVEFIRMTGRTVASAPGTNKSGTK